jgi:hypothetical protein
MAKSSKKSGKRFTNKVHKVVKSDIFTSVAILSIVLNMFLLAGVFVLTSADTYDRSLYESVRVKYCKNVDGVVERSKELGSSADALKEWKVTCLSDEFAPFYKEALKKFEASTKN